MPERRPALREQSDEELIATFQQGTVEAFNQIVGRYKDQLMNFVFRYLGDYDEADDIVQEVFIRVYRNKHAYKPIAKFSTWIYTIAANLAKTQLRRRKRHASFSFHRGKEGENNHDYSIPDTRYPADGQAESSLKQAIIQKALDSINPKYREVVILSDIQELSYEEICQITGLNIGTIKSRLSRGRAKLQILLKSLLLE
ncbi:MAG: sigma-70 family RNA polymerase sigma factor [Ignavibacteria bacterium]|nr:sigma-70 family RNA polymerase sigma factor [Ignavibacteria bacterium]MBI3766839.1 sigma-70 family RNA polymerase sigma factor [Ignavibacteriales bacterium]